VAEEQGEQVESVVEGEGRPRLKDKDVSAWEGFGA